MRGRTLKAGELSVQQPGQGLADAVVAWKPIDRKQLAVMAIIVRRSLMVILLA